MGIYVNDSSISKILLGNEEVSTISLGNTEIYDGGGETEVKDRLEFWGDDSFSLKSGNSGIKYWDGTLEYTTDGENWTAWTGASISSQPKDNAHYLALRGTNNTYLTYQQSSGFTNYCFTFSGNAQSIDCRGDVSALFDYQTFVNGGSPAIATRACAGLFYQQTKLRTAPQISITDAPNECYLNMFYGCTELQSGPVIIPATTIGEYSCYHMFSGCSSLKRPPALPATSISRNSYQNMFSNCTLLEALPALPSLGPKQDSYAYMFYGCTKIKMSATQTGEYVNAYRVPSQGTGSSFYSWGNYMFYNTGGTYTDSPYLNSTVYTSNEIIPAN